MTFRPDRRRLSRSKHSPVTVAWRVLGALLLASVLGASCRQGPVLPASALHDLASFDQFRVAFNAEASRPRLIVVLAPT